MASSITSVITTRVKNKVKDKFEAMCEGKSKADVFENLLSNAAMADNRFDRFYDILSDKGYPDSAIDSMMDDILKNASDMPKYNKRSRYDTGC